MAKKKKEKKVKKEADGKSDSQIFLEELTVIVADTLKKTKWAQEDAEVKKEADGKSDSQIFLEELTVIVADTLKKTKWAQEDAEMKKKLTKKDKQKLAQRRAEELKQAVEAERIRLQEEEKRKLEEERLAAIAKETTDILEQTQRVEQLKESCNTIRKLQRQWLRNEKKDFLFAEWTQYLKCDGLPDPSNCGEMNTYLHLWDKVKDNTVEEMAVQKTDEVLKLLHTLEDFLDCPAVSDTKKKDWLQINNNFRDYQQFNLDCLAYRLLRDIPTKLERLDIKTARKLITHPEGTFMLCVWALIQLPIPAPNPKRPPRPPTNLDFPELCDMYVAFPSNIDVWAKCVRAMYVKYDHFSHKADCYAAPPAPDKLNASLAEVSKEEYDSKKITRETIKKRVMDERETEIKRLFQVASNTEKEDDIHAYQSALRKQKDFINVDASAVYLLEEDAQYADLHKIMVMETPENAINLRKYRILGGVFFLDLFYQPPQPTTMVLSEITLATLSLPKFLESVPFLYEFTPSPPVEPGVTRKPEEIEAEIKRVEAEYENLILISLQLPSNVLWLDPPTVCQWDEEESMWSTKNVHDSKYNEEKQTIQFRIGRFGPFAMATYRYNNMPYQAWELKPAAGNKVVFTIMAAVLILEFTVSGSQISLTQLQNAPSDALDYLIGQYYTLPRLKRLLRKGGVDVFPNHDVFLYLKGACEKQYPTEKHTYFQMAQCSLYFNFSWSRWNLLAGRRTLVMQMRESGVSERGKQVRIEPNYQMLMVTPLRALLINCTEVSQNFTTEPAKRMKFYADLYHLINGISNVTIRCKLEKSPTDVINTVAQLLIATRVMSLS